CHRDHRDLHSFPTRRSSDLRFITIEGVEGVGKSTNIRFITQLLQEAGIEHVVTREPGGTAIAELIRQLLLAHHAENICEMTELRSEEHTSELQSRENLVCRL